MHMLRFALEINMRIVFRGQSLACIHRMRPRFLTQFLYQKHLLVYWLIVSFKLVDRNLFSLKECEIIALNVQFKTVTIDKVY